MATDKIQIGLRVPEDLRAKIQAAADARGVAVNKEITDRIERTFNEEITFSGEGKSDLYVILRVVAAAMDTAGPMAAIMSTLNPEADRDWINNSIAFEQAINAAVVVLEAFRPKTVTQPHRSTPASIAQIGEEIAEEIITEAATGETKTLGQIEAARARRLHSELGAIAERVQDFASIKVGDPAPASVSNARARLNKKRSAKKGKRV